METTPEYMQDNVIFLCPASADLAIAVDYAGCAVKFKCSDGLGY